MIVGEAEFRFLKKGQTRTVHIPVQAGRGRRAGAIMPGPEIDAVVRAQPAAFERGITCTVIDVQRDRSRNTWRITLAPGDLTTEPPRYLRASGGKPRGNQKGTDPTARGYTDSPDLALLDDGQPIETVPDSYQRYLSSLVDELHKQQHPSATPAVDRDLARQVEEKLREDLARYVGWTPEQIERHSRVQGDQSAIRQRRRHMSMRAIDGYPRLTPGEEDQRLQQLLAADAADREIARALDCSRDRVKRLTQLLEWEDHRAA